MADEGRESWEQRALDQVRTKQARVAVVGCGYVGLTLAVSVARAGMRVVGVEANETRAKQLLAGVNPVPDVALDDGELSELMAAGTLSFATSLDAPADVYVICVNTPLRDGSPDLRYVEEAGEAVGRRLQRAALVVLESTTYPGTTEELLGPLLEETSGLRPGIDFALAHSPERINPADRTWTMQNTPKVVGGLTVASTEIAAAFYAHVCSQIVTVSSPRTAEITKLLENSYRQVNIALANEMAIVCNDFGIDPWEVLEAASTKPYGFTAFRPGPGVGGECVPIDPQYLAWRVRGKTGHQFRILETAADINDRMPAYVAQRAAEILNDRGKALRGARILILGLAFKGGSSDTRESPAVRVTERLARSGATLAYHDPFVSSATIDGEGYDSADLTDEAIASSDLVVVLVDHPGVDYERVVAGARCVYDTRGVTSHISPEGAQIYRS
jgi:UDP-N-acetyl-D-glucosamine dehydrogenase